MLRKKESIILIVCLTVLVGGGVLFKNKTAVSAEADSQNLMQSITKTNKKLDPLVLSEVLVNSAKMNAKKASAFVETAKPEEPKSQEKEEDTKKVNTPDKEDLKGVYLTFDDGPNPNTLEILDILKERNIKATFFLNGQPKFEYIYKRIIKEGHAIGNHSWNHRYESVYASPEAFVENVTQFSDYMKGLGYTTKLFRFPGGSNNTVYKKYGSSNCMDENIKWIKANGYYYLDWNVGSTDAAGKKVTASSIYNATMYNIRNKDVAVVLMHSKKVTAQALPRILDDLIAQGRTFKSLDPEPQTDDSKLMRIKFK